MSPENKNSMLAIAACVIFFIAYQTYITDKYPAPVEGAQSETLSQQPSSATEPTPQGEPLEAKDASNRSQEPSRAFNKLSPEQLRFENDVLTLEFQQEHAAVTKFLLKNYKASQGGTESMNIVDPPFKMHPVTSIGERFNRGGFSAYREGNQLSFRIEDDTWVREIHYTLPDSGYSLDISVGFKNKSASSQELTAGLLSSQKMVFGDSESFGPAAFVVQRKMLVYGVKGDLDSEDAGSFCSDSEINELADFRIAQQEFDFVGFDHHYFLNIVKPKSPKMDLRVTKGKDSTASLCPLEMLVYQPMGYIQPGDSVKFDFTAFFGPKDTDLLEAYDPAFKEAVDFHSLGVNLGVLANPLLSVIKFFHDLVPNYGIAIILLTICLKILFTR